MVIQVPVILVRVIGGKKKSSWIFRAAALHFKLLQYWGFLCRASLPVHSGRDGFFHTPQEFWASLYHGLWVFMKFVPWSLALCLELLPVKLSDYGWERRGCTIWVSWAAAQLAVVTRTGFGAGQPRSYLAHLSSTTKVGCCLGKPCTHCGWYSSDID